MTMTKKKPKAFILAFKNLYLNSTDDVLYKVLEEVYDVFFYGPGYTPLDELILNPVEVYEKFGPFDICFVHQYVLHHFHSAPNFLNDPSNNQHFDFNGKLFCKKYADFGKGYNNIPCAKILIALRLDCYAFTKEEKEECDTFNGHLILPAPEFFPPTQFQGNVEEEEFSHKSTDRYIDFCKENHERIIPIVHLIAEDDFIKIPQKDKKYLISVPGCPYYERLKVFNKLEKLGYSPMRELLSLILFRYIIYYSKIRLGAYPIGINFFKSAFKKLISNSIMSFTDGSQVKAPIRKFFEIPAYGSLLLAEPFWKAEKLGFTNGEHFIECNSENVVDVIEYYKKHPNLAEKITETAQKMIKEKHSDKAWVERFSHIHDAIQNSTYYGAVWNNGILEYSLKK